MSMKCQQRSININRSLVSAIQMILLQCWILSLSSFSNSMALDTYTSLVHIAFSVIWYFQCVHQILFHITCTSVEIIWNGIVQVHVACTVFEAILRNCSKTFLELYWNKWLEVFWNHPWNGLEQFKNSCWTLNENNF